MYAEKKFWVMTPVQFANSYQHTSTVNLKYWQVFQKTLVSHTIKASTITEITAFLKFGYVQKKGKGLK